MLVNDEKQWKGEKKVVSRANRILMIWIIYWNWNCKAEKHTHIIIDYWQLIDEY